MFETNRYLQDDLLLFHVRNYGTHFSGRVPCFDPIVTSDEADMDDDHELGYYHDGKKRTLTDDQIAMFRHSEIQSHLREQKRRAEKETSEYVSVARSQELEAGVWGSQEVVEDGDNDEDGEVEDEEEYENFLEAERREMELVTSRQRVRAGKNKNQRSKTGKSSTRRMVRELDEVGGSMDVLDYGEEPDLTATPVVNEREIFAPSSHLPGGPSSDKPPQGRNFWWPTLGT
ncbi:hypothetical protein MMC13_007459 [Lambiella insularis]|nr:hypothetical protein [Lambiella insularis]